jgi:hypothetical protein
MHGIERITTQWQVDANNRRDVCGSFPLSHRLHMTIACLFSYHAKHYWRHSERGSDQDVPFATALNWLRDEPFALAFYFVHCHASAHLDHQIYAALRSSYDMTCKNRDDHQPFEDAGKTPTEAYVVHNPCKPSFTTPGDKRTTGVTLALITLN